jgi:hypothetical protein
MKKWSPTRSTPGASVPCWRHGRASCACTDCPTSSDGSDGGSGDASSGGRDGISRATPSLSGHHHHAHRFVPR